MKKNDQTPHLDRRGFMKKTAAAGVVASSPMFFMKGAYAAKDFRNDPKDSLC